MANKAFEKSMRALIEEIRKQNNGTFFYDDTDAVLLCKLIYYGWVLPIMHGSYGIYRAFLNTKRIGDPEIRAQEITKRLSRPWSFDEYHAIYFKILEMASRRTHGNTAGRSLTDTEIPNLIAAIEKVMLEKNLIWFTPYLAAALVAMKQARLNYQAEIDRADEAMKRVWNMIALEEQAQKAGTVFKI
jgi:hypothetical protein